METRKSQIAYEISRKLSGSTSIEDRIYSAMYLYLRDDLGLQDSVARSRAQIEISGQIGRTVCDECEGAGITLQGSRVLDLGAGLGGVSAEVARRGGFVVGIEPGSGWRQLAAERIAEAGKGSAVGAVGEQMPVASNSIDLILSLQVLEHVQHPAQVIQEAFRVLKPGGHFFFSYENYLSFWEPHYRVRWFPLLPKPVGAVYLKLLGRNPRFFTESVTYTTFPSVRRALLRTGFECRSLESYKLALNSPAKTGLKWKVLKALSSLHKPSALSLFVANDYAHRTFKTGIWEFMRKPDRLHSAS